MTLKNFIRTYNSHMGTPAKIRVAKHFNETVEYLYLGSNDINIFVNMFADVEVVNWSTALFDETHKTRTGESYNIKVLMITIELEEEAR